MWGGEGSREVADREEGDRERVVEEGVDYYCISDSRFIDPATTGT